MMSVSLFAHLSERGYVSIARRKLAETGNTPKVEHFNVMGVYGGVGAFLYMMCLYFTLRSLMKPYNYSHANATIKTAS
jgi:hypothetical protein